MTELNPRQKDPLLRSYFASHGGGMEFWPDPYIVDPMVADGLWFVAPCNKNRTTHGAVSCKIEVGALTDEGIRQGRRIVADFLAQLDNEKAKKIIELLPFHVRSLLLCLLTRNYSITLKGSSELNSILTEITNRVNLYILPVPKDLFSIIFDSVTQLFQYATDKLNLYGLGMNNSRRHDTSGWKVYPPVYDTCPEIVRLLVSVGVPYDELFLSHASQQILNAAPKQLAKLELLSRLAMAKPRNETVLPESRTVGLDDLEVERTLSQFVKELQKNGILSNRDEWDRVHLVGEITLELITPLVNDFTSALEKWWKMTLPNDGKEIAVKHSTQSRNHEQGTIVFAENEPKSRGQEKTPAVEPPTVIPTPLPKKSAVDRETISIWLGTDENHKDSFWRPFAEVNPHLLICGFSGTGKTQSLKTIVNELDRSGVPSIIFDFKGNTFQLGTIVDIDKVTVNPLELDFKEGQDISKASTPKDKSLNVSQAFDKIFKLGEQQRAKLAEAFLRSFQERGIIEDNPKSWAKEQPTLDDVEKILDTMSQDPKMRSTVTTLQGRLQTILWKRYFSSPTTLPLSEMVSNKTTVDFKSIKDEDSKIAIAEVILQKILGYMYSAGPSRDPRFYVIVDEAHRLAYEKSAMDLLAREGREYGVGLIVASQFFKDFKKEVAGNLSSIIAYHVQPSEEARYVAQQLGEPINEDYLLNKLKGPFNGVLKLNSIGEPIKFRFVPEFERKRT